MITVDFDASCAAKGGIRRSIHNSYPLLSSCSTPLYLSPSLCLPLIMHSITQNHDCVLVCGIKYMISGGHAVQYDARTYILPVHGVVLCAETIWWSASLKSSRRTKPLQWQLMDSLSSCQAPLQSKWKKSSTRWACQSNHSGNKSVFEKQAGCKSSNATPPYSNAVIKLHNLVYQHQGLD